MRNSIIVGIDPDVERNGVCRLFDTNEVVVECVDFNDLLPLLLTTRNTLTSIYGLNGLGVVKLDLLVVVEASWVTGHNWHLPKYCSLPAAAKMGYNVGRNHEVGMLIVEFCRRYGIPVKEQPPLKKMWSGPDGKITQKEIEAFIPKFPKRSNQEMRDATLLAWFEAGLPIKLSAG